MSDLAATPTTALIPARASLSTSYRMLLRWQFAQIGSLLPLLVLIQALLAAAIIVGFGFLIPNIDTATARLLSTGTPTVLLLIIGFVIVPDSVSRARTDGRFAYQRALPVPRPLLFLADLTVWLIVSLPSIVVAMLVAELRYDLGLSFDWPLLIVTSLLITITAAAVGYAIAVSLPTVVVQLVSQALSFFVILFSPVTFPARQLPGWFQTLHDVLPVRPAADLLRAGLASGAYEASMRDLVVVGLWCLVGIGFSMRALVRRS